MQQQSRFASISGYKSRYYLSQLSEWLRTSQAILHRRPYRAHCLIGGRVRIFGPYLPLRLNRPNLGPFSENRRQAEAAQPRSRSSLPTASTPCLLCALTWKLFSVASGLPSGPPLLRPPVHKNHDGAVLICRVDMTFCPNSPLIKPNHRHRRLLRARRDRFLICMFRLLLQTASLAAFNSVNCLIYRVL